MTNFNIKAPNLSIEKSLIEKINNLNKPKESLGRLEEIALQIEKEQLAGFVKGDVLKDLLPVLDNFERAVQAPAEGDTKVFLDGFVMIHQNLMAMLSKHGLAVIDAVGKPFDPNFHQAIMRVPSDEYESDTVCEVLQTGYTVDGRCIRPAMVKVVE